MKGDNKMDKLYDVIILGAGPAGLAAGLYAGRARLSTLIIEKAQDGGQISITDEIENYPGQAVLGESGPSLIARMTKQCENFGCERMADTVKSVDFSGKVKKVIGEKGEYQAKAVIIATGAHPRPIGCEGEKEFLSKGVSYCATCDGMFYRGKVVAVNGGGNTAVEDATFLSDYVQKVYVIHRRDEFRADKAEVDRLTSKPNVELVLNSTVKRLESDASGLTGVVVANKDGEERTLKVDGLFVAIGQAPDNQAFSDLVELDGKGYISAGESTLTKTPGIFTAGDCRTKAIRQLATAASDGAVAGLAAVSYINEKGL